MKHSTPFLPQWWRARYDQLGQSPNKPLLSSMPMDDLKPIDEVEGSHFTGLVKVPKGKVADFDALSSAAADIGYPVVLKMTNLDWSIKQKPEPASILDQRRL